MRANQSIYVLINFWLLVSSNTSVLNFGKVHKSCVQLNGTDGCECIGKFQPECCCMGNSVEHLPTTISPNMVFFYMYNTSIPEVTSNFFANYTRLKEIEIEGSEHLQHFDASSLSSLRNLRKVSVTKCPNLIEISGKLLVNNTKIQNLILRNNGIKTMPSLRMTDSHQITLDRIDLSNNQIKFISDSKIRNVRARAFYLNNNNLIEISGYAFTESRFVRLILRDNPHLSTISIDAFKNMGGLRELDLSRTSITVLPINGLKNLKTLKLTEVPTLRRLPSVLSFTNLETAHFTYPHHCCLFKYVDDVTMMEHGKYQKNAKEIHKRICNEKKETKSAMSRNRQTPDQQAFFDQLLKDWFENDNGTYGGDDSIDDGELPPFTQIGAQPCYSVIEEVQNYYSNITCYPQPDSLNPCENIVGYPLLRIAIWVVCLSAIVGNIIVWVTLAVAYEKRMKVHYLYMANMSIADMITGVYLAVLAISDAKMSDEYYRHAVWWQTGWGCRSAGFLAVFASELGIISMFLIAFEMSYNTRQSFRGRRLGATTGGLLMIGGWIFATIMGILPWFGASSYSESSVCLPLRAASIFDKAYLIFGLTFNCLAFVAMAVSYGFIVKMLKENETRDEDKALIKKMVLLVVTDLICWFPTLFFGFTAAIGYPLISLSNAKFVLVFFFPINAFANPFLYVFFTKVIQNRVRTKTLPVIRRITPRCNNSLSNFYNSQPPCSRRRSGDDPSNRAHLAVTQTTSLNSTPRGSNCSRASDALLFEVEPRNITTPRVSFDIPISPTTPRSDRRKQITLLRRFVSAIPEVSDLSEHSSESHHEHIPKPRKRLQNSLNRILALGNRTDRCGGDSGRGSLASSADREFERASLNSADSRLSEQMEPRKLIFPPDRTIDRRKSTPAIPLLVVSEAP
ncbi:unnamed protein product [Caenorhabditis bovis]|uniref:G-protein coupled receptors family 1 profile domain-containing protein n=1 Tax=Caenorhabditis bovis TaxID=2654633 RepID=A0A8S1E9V2_9PELO|nr:unnamed protein product [Caenorhabditis bovis]